MYVYGFYERVCSEPVFPTGQLASLRSVSHCDRTVNTVACSVQENGLL